MKYKCVSLIAAVCLLGAGPPNGPKPEGGKSSAEKIRERVEVAGVLGTEDGQYVVVLRTHAKPLRYLPIWIGEVEALNIRLRLERQRPPRPLTLNLLESVMQSGNIRLTEIAIDSLKSGVFLGTIVLNRDARKWSVDARPSDAIGLAVAKGVPIWVNAAVLVDAAIDPALLSGAVEGETPPPPTRHYSETL